MSHVPSSRAAAKEPAEKPSIYDHELWRWLFVTPATLIVTGLALSSIFAYSVFIAPVRTERPNWSSSAVSYAVSIQGFMGGVGPFWVGRQLARNGVRFWILIGIFVMTVGFMLSGLALIWVRALLLLLACVPSH